MIGDESNIGAELIGGALTGAAPQPHAQLLSMTGAGAAQQSTTGAGQQLGAGGGQAGAHRGGHGAGTTLQQDVCD